MKVTLYVHVNSNYRQLCSVTLSSTSVVKFRMTHLLIIIIIIIMNGSAALCSSLAFVSIYCSYTQSVGLLGWGISPAQRRYLHTEQHKHIINANIHPFLEWNSNPRPWYYE
jgi:hypothetical protein